MVHNSHYLPDGYQQWSDPGLAVLSYGTLVSAANEDYEGIIGAYARIGSIYNVNGGFWSPGAWSGQSGYLGFAFQTPPSGPEDGYTAHYGWFRMAELNGVLELYEWAYETQDNTALYAGQVPEPSQAACLCAGIAMCFLRRNRTV